MKGTEHLSVGKIGEQIACQFLVSRGFKIIDTNVTRKCGELDIVARNKKTGRIHIVEVKTVSGSVASAWGHPSENLTEQKIKKLERTCLVYIKENKIINWQLDAILVWYEKSNSSAQIEYLTHIV